MNPNAKKAKLEWSPLPDGVRVCEVQGFEFHLFADGTANVHYPGITELIALRDEIACQAFADALEDLYADAFSDGYHEGMGF
jgi:hypothetical protein